MRFYFMRCAIRVAGGHRGPPATRMAKYGMCNRRSRHRRYTYKAYVLYGAASSGHVPLEKCGLCAKVPLEKCKYPIKVPLEKCGFCAKVPLEKCNFAT